MELQVQEFNLCRSISICLFSLYKFASFMILNLKVKEGATADWILELEVPFSGRAISIISLLFVINSKVHNTLTWKRSILPNFWVLVKISLFLLTQNIIQIVVLSTFEELTGTITSYITNITVNFPSKPSKIFPCVSVDMWNHSFHCWICFFQLLLNFIHSRHELIDFLAKRKPN